MRRTRIMMGAAAGAGSRGVRLRACCLASATLMAALLWMPGAAGAEPPPAASKPLIIDLDNRLGEMRIEETPEGYRLSIDGVEGITPEQFAEVIYREKKQQQDAGIVFVIFNITSWWGLLWVSVGLFGQLLFTFRMVLQWLASEKEHKSVVPVGFWWGSLIGGLMLLSYFMWRKDAIGILGQSTGAIIYARNLWLIYFGQKTVEVPRELDMSPSAAPEKSGDVHA